MLFTRHLDDTYSPRLREHLDTLISARLVTNACYRYAPPFIATIASGLNVSVTRIGIALTVGETAGLVAPIVGRFVDRLPRRRGMLIGVWGIVGSVMLASSSTSVIVLAVAMFGLGLFKLLFDGCTTAWVNDHVPYERRGRVVGIIETSWALGLLVGVLLMGIITGLTSWRYGFGFGGAVSAVCAYFILRSLPNEPAVKHDLHPDAKGRVHGAGWLVVVAMFLLMVAAQAVGVTFGPWLSDSFDSSDFVIAVVVFIIGGCELLASITVTRRADIWGKERSVVIGALLMVPSGVLIALSHHNQIAGLAALMLFFGFFEYTVVAMFPIAAHLVPGRTGAGLGAVIGAGTFGRAVATPMATSLYDVDRFGFAGPALIGAATALGACLLMHRFRNAR